jgi:aspartyl-tRNA(Asn)/glutamyl-tRNA(Gln) amidotransferase subunit B
MQYEAVIGLEVHAQLSTDSKIFCTCSTRFGADPNTQTCPICLGMPGVLPVLNKKVVEYAIRMALATHAKIRDKSVFARKNYFYPDLPKGFQISQYEHPLCEKGYLEIELNGSRKKLGITRIHIEEDPAKSIHDRSDSEAFLDFNRSGTPLIEIVSEPDMRTPEEAYLYLTKLKQLLQYTDVCDGNMEKGNLRCDANISIRPEGETKLGTKTEMKNMNSFRNVEKAIAYEVKRQQEILEAGEKVVQETLLWDASANSARVMRSKEDAHDYRYFPEPDLMTLDVTPDWIEGIKKSMPELPDKRCQRFIEQYSIPEYDAKVLTEDKGIADYYEAAVSHHVNPKVISNWVMGDILRVVKEEKKEVQDINVKPEHLADMVRMIDDNTISGKIAKTVFEEMAATGADPKKIVKDKGLVQVTDTGQIEEVVKQVLANNPGQVEKFKAGKTKVMGFFVGEVMKATQGRANPKLVNEILRKKLSE